MILLKQTGLFEKLYRSLVKYSSLTSSSIFEQKIGPHTNNVWQARLLTFLECPDTKNNKCNECMDNSKLNSQTLEMCNAIEHSNLLCEKKSSEYDELVASINTILLSERGSKTTNALRLVDQQCCKLLTKLSKSEILHVLHLFMRSRFNITKLKLYRSSLLALRKYLEKGQLCVGETLQLLFFESSGKKLATRNMKFLIDFLPPLSNLSLMEKSVVAYSTFKCNVKLKTEDIKTLEDTLETNAAELVKDIGILVTICKSIRHAGPTNDCSLVNLSREMIEKDGIFMIMEAAHILGLYVEAKHENSTLTNRLFHDSMRNLSNNRQQLMLSTMKFPVRIKDVDRLLWASSFLNYRLSLLDRREISLFIDRRYREFEEKPFLLVNTLLSLWILNCKLTKVIDKCLRNDVFRLVNKQNDRWKPIARLHLLLNCIKIECKEIKLPDELFNTHKVSMKVDKSVKRLCKIINELREKFNIDEPTIDCPVSGIHIAGVSVKSGNVSIHIDLLNDTTCFKGTKTPHGLTNLKLRLLEKIQYHSVLMTEEQSNDPEFVLSTVVRCMKDVTCDKREKKFSSEEESVKINVIR